MAKDVLAVIIGNRDFFPDVLVGEARKDLIKLLGELGIEAVMLSPEESKLGAVETWADAKRCGELFRKHGERISGILVCLPNFGDEKAVADSIRLSGRNVPILVQASPDDLDRFGLDRRRVRRNHVHLGSSQAAAAHLAHLQARAHAERGRRPLKAVERNARVHHRAQQHIAADAGKTL